MATRKARYVVPAAVLAAALVVSGCGGDSSTKPNPDTAREPDRTPTVPPTVPTVTPAQALERFNEAKTAAGDMGRKLNNMSTQAMIDDARTKVNAAWEARMQLSETDRTALTTLRTNFRQVEEGRARHLYGKISAAIMNINDYDPATITAARKALTDAEDAYTKAGLTGAFATLRSRIGDRETQAGKKIGEAMYAALGGPNTPNLGAGRTGTQTALNNLENAAEYTFTQNATNKVVGLKLDPRADGGSLPDTSTSGPDFPVVLTKVEDAGKVGDWTVTRRSEGRRNTTGEKPKDLNGKETLFDRVLMYKLDRTPTMVKAAVHFESDSKPSFAGDHTPDERLLSLGTGVDRHIAAPGFPKAGDANDLKPNEEGSSQIRIRGTYQGAPGWYLCVYTSGADCRVSVGNYGVYFLADKWTFKYDEGAEVVFKGDDTDFAYFGWWVRENKGDGMPRMITSFIGAHGDVGEPADVTGYSGTATYEGPAAGQYAIHDPLNNKGEAGEFTAKATLNAKFGNSSNEVDTGLSGTISEFKLNGGSGDPNWSVALKRTGWATGGTKIIGADGRTTWTIDGVPGSEVRGWEAELFDTTDDDNTNPDLVLGRFYSEHGHTHRLVGAFGAEPQVPTTE